MRDVVNIDNRGEGHRYGSDRCRELYEEIILLTLKKTGGLMIIRRRGPSYSGNWIWRREGS